MLTWLLLIFVAVLATDILGRLPLKALLVWSAGMFISARERGFAF